MSPRHPSSPLGVFGSLPAEIRREIYYHALNVRAQEGIRTRGLNSVEVRKGNVTWRRKKIQSCYSIGINLLLTSKALYAEAGDYFYYQNDLIRVSLPVNESHPKVNIWRLLDENLFFYYFGAGNHEAIGACQRHALDVFVRKKKGKRRYIDIMICASQIEHIVRYLCAFLLNRAPKDEHPYNISFNLRTAKRGFFMTALRPFQVLQGFNNAHFIVSRSVSRIISPADRQNGQELTKLLVRQMSPLGTWLGLAKTFLTEIEHLLGSVSPPFEQLRHLISYHWTSTHVPKIFEKVLMTSAPQAWAYYAFLRVWQWLVTIRHGLLEGTLGDWIFENFHDWLPRLIRMLLEADGYLPPDGLRRMILRTYRTISEVVFFFTSRGQKELDQILIEILEMFRPYGRKLFMLEVQEDLDRVKAIQAGDQDTFDVVQSVCQG